MRQSESSGHYEELFPSETITNKSFQGFCHAKKTKFNENTTLHVESNRRST